MRWNYDYISQHSPFIVINYRRVFIMENDTKLSGNYCTILIRVRKLIDPSHLVRNLRFIGQLHRHLARNTHASSEVIKMIENRYITRLRRER